MYESVENEDFKELIHVVAKAGYLVSTFAWELGGLDGHEVLHQQIPVR